MSLLLLLSAAAPVSRRQPVFRFSFIYFVRMFGKMFTFVYVSAVQVNDLPGIQADRRLSDWRERERAKEGEREGRLDLTHVT